MSARPYMVPVAVLVGSAPGCVLEVDGGNAGFAPDAGSGTDAAAPADAAGNPTDAPAADATPPCDEAFVVDGVPDEWVWDGAWTPVTKQTIGADTGVTAEFKARWTPTHLNVAARVYDTALVNDSVNVWEDDSIEVYVDVNHDRTTTYGADDFQFIAGWADAEIWEAGDRTAGALIEDAVAGDHYTMEIAIPWTILDATPAVGVTHGFDVGINIDQDGGTEEGQLMWNGTVDNWQDTSAFGTLTPAADCAVVLGI